MYWDYILILLLLGIFIPWRSRARVTWLLKSPELNSGGRTNLYLSTIAFQWIASIVIVWRWLTHGSGLFVLGIGLPNLRRAVIATVLLSSLLVLNQIAGVKRVASIAAEKRGLVAQLAAKLLPRTKTERYAALLLVLSVSICEEFIYRGFVQTVFQQLTASALAGAAVSAVFFGLAHLYQGQKGILTTLAVGFLFSVVRIWTGSLWPSIFIHFAVDFSAGEASRRLLRIGETA